MAELEAGPGRGSRAASDGEAAWVLRAAQELHPRAGRADRGRHRGPPARAAGRPGRGAGGELEQGRQGARRAGGSPDLCREVDSASVHLTATGRDELNLIRSARLVRRAAGGALSRPGPSWIREGEVHGEAVACCSTARWGEHASTLSHRRRRSGPRLGEMSALVGGAATATVRAAPRQPAAPHRASRRLPRRAPADGRCRRHHPGAPAGARSTATAWSLRRHVRRSRQPRHGRLRPRVAAPPPGPRPASRAREQGARRPVLTGESEVDLRVVGSREVRESASGARDRSRCARAQARPAGPGVEDPRRPRRSTQPPPGTNGA